jgi:hypothetical protein
LNDFNRRTRLRIWGSGVRISSGAPFAYKTANISVLDLFARDGGLQDILAAYNTDGFIIDFDRIDDRADVTCVYRKP